MKYTIGFIGTGNMGGSLATAASKSVPPEQMILSNQPLEAAQALADRFGCTAGDSETVARESRLIFLGVKPHIVGSVLSNLRQILKERSTPPVLVSMAAGVTIRQIQEMAGSAYPVIRIMPNTPVSLGAGVILYERSHEVTDEDFEAFSNAMSAAGVISHLEESLIDAGSAVSGCSPAFFYLFIDALADGGVACGLSRQNALLYAAQTAMGAAKMILTTGKHPDQLKNEVCSPGGSTIQGVRTLEQRAVRAAVMDAVISACEKTAQLGKS